MWAENNRLAVRCRNRDDSRTADLTSSSGGGWHSNIRRKVGGNFRVATDVIVIFGQIERVCDLKADCLCRVNWRSATEADDAVASILFVSRNSVQNVLLCWIGIDSRKYGRGWDKLANAIRHCRVNKTPVRD